ncbi:MAG: Regulatory protein AfsR [Nocardia sp.]|uniref:BTAD domain-containing putative transcriptional regulator n=1 Tax=Nocardia sp. TaxID=1821 RepID=UPI00261D358D|nr:BTAD domain-containing putative transcriptional regulator [Nocardia sp.]MCU1643249.1 Regulatory protein AfsR [Nocardia sp.]
MADTRIGVLGPLHISIDDQRVPPGAPMQCAVLGRLVAAGGRVVPTDRLIDDLWSGDPPTKAVAALQVYIHNLRRVFEPDRPRRAQSRIIVSESHGYALNLEPEQVDSWHFEQLLHGHESAMRDPAVRPDPLEQVRVLDAALGCWHGGAFESFAGMPWAAQETARLAALRLTAAELRAQAALEMNRPAEVVLALRPIFEEFPGREECARLLALAQYRLGQSLDALATVRHSREFLTLEFGVDPGPGLRDLETAILTHSVETEVPAPPIVVRTADPDVLLSQDPLRDSGYAEQRAGLLAAAESAAAGQVRLVWLSGEAGAGKTTLAATIVTQLAGQSWTTVFGRCPEVEGAPPAWAWSEVLTGLDAADPESYTAADAFTLARRVVRSCRERAATGPVAIVLEDVHGADTATLQVLRQVVNWLRDRPIFIMATMRGTEAGPGVRDTAAALALFTADRIELDGLDLAGTRRAAAAAGLTTLDDRTVELLRRRTGGNPLFVRELAKLVAGQGSTDGLPDSVRDLLGRRIAQLPDQVTELLRHMSVWGEHSDVNTLAASAGHTADTVIDLIAGAESARLLRTERSGRIAFDHALVRETVYYDIPVLRRARMHWAAFELLCSRTPAAPSAPPITAIDALAHSAAVSKIIAAQSDNEADSPAVPSRRELSPGSRIDALGHSAAVSKAIVQPSLGGAARVADSPTEAPAVSDGHGSSSRDVIEALADAVGISGGRGLSPGDVIEAFADAAAGSEGGSAASSSLSSSAIDALTAAIATPRNGDAARTALSGNAIYAATDTAAPGTTGTARPKASRTAIDALVHAVAVPGSVRTIAQASPGTDIDALAHHASLGANAETAVRALEFVRAAARRCVERRMRADAVRRWRSVLALHDMAGHGAATAARADRAALLEARCELVTALAYDGQHIAARAAREQALDLAESLGGTEFLARAATCWPTPLIWSVHDWHTPDPRLREPLSSTLADPRLPVSTRIRIRVNMVFDRALDDPAAAGVAAADASALAAPGADPELLCTVLNAQAFAAFARKGFLRADDLKRHATRMLRIATEAELTEFRALAHYLLFRATLADADLVAAAEHARSAGEYATDGQLRHLLDALAPFDMVLELLRGNTEGVALMLAVEPAAAAELVAHSAEGAAEPSREPNALHIGIAISLAWARNDMSEFVDELRERALIKPELFVYGYALALLHSGQEEAARSVLRESPPLAPQFWTTFTSVRARLAIGLADRDWAHELYDQLLPYAGTIAGLESGATVLGPMDLTLAELAEFLGDPERAAAHRTAAARLRERIALDLALLDERAAPSRVPVRTHQVREVSLSQSCRVPDPSD